MSVVLIVILSVVGYLLGSALLLVSMRRVAKVPFSFTLAAIAYLAMLLVGAFAGAVAFYVSIEMVQLRAVAGLILSVVLATMAECVTGVVFTRRVAPRAALAVALPVVVLNLVGLLAWIPIVARVENKSNQMRVLSELREQYVSIMQQSYEANGGFPGTLQVFASDPAFSFGSVKIADLEYLPEYLNRAGVPGPYRDDRMKAAYPLLWPKTSTGGEIPVLYCDGHSAVVPRPVLESQLQGAVDELRRAQDKK